MCPTAPTRARAGSGATTWTNCARTRPGSGSGGWRCWPTWCTSTEGTAGEPAEPAHPGGGADRRLAVPAPSGLDVRTALEQGAGWLDLQRPPGRWWTVKEAAAVAGGFVAVIVVFTLLAGGYLSLGTSAQGPF